MPEWIGTIVFLSALGLSGAKISGDFGKRGLRGYALLLVMLVIYAAAVTVIFV
jgi:hypothetical protein